MFFHESVFPGPLSIPLRQFQILRINFVFIAGVIDYGEMLLPMETTPAKNYRQCRVTGDRLLPVLLSC